MYFVNKILCKQFTCATSCAQNILEKNVGQNMFSKGKKMSRGYKLFQFSDTTKQ